MDSERIFNIKKHFNKKPLKWNFLISIPQNLNPQKFCTTLLSYRIMFWEAQLPKLKIFKDCNEREYQLLALETNHSKKPPQKLQNNLNQYQQPIKPNYIFLTQICFISLGMRLTCHFHHRCSFTWWSHRSSPSPLQLFFVQILSL